MDWRISVTSAGSLKKMDGSRIIPWKKWALTLITFAKEWQVTGVVQIMRANTVKFELRACQIATNASQNYVLLAVT